MHTRPEGRSYDGESEDPRREGEKRPCGGHGGRPLASLQTRAAHPTRGVEDVELRIGQNGACEASLPKSLASSRAEVPHSGVLSRMGNCRIALRDDMT